MADTKQFTEESDVLKQFMELLNQQNMKEQSQDFMGIFWYVAGMQVQLSAMVDVGIKDISFFGSLVLGKSLLTQHKEHF